MSERWDYLDAGVHTIEAEARLDRVAGLLDQATAPIERSSLFPALRGDWLGHALHPLLTDLPIGFWTAAGLLDVFGGKNARGARRRLVGAGLLCVPATIAAGLAEWRMLRSRATRRVAAVHAVGNVLASLAYFRSWRHRGHGSHGWGVVWGMAGASIAVITGYLGGHLSYGRDVGTGRRGRSTRARRLPDLGDGEIRLASGP